MASTKKFISSSKQKENNFATDKTIPWILDAAQSILSSGAKWAHAYTTWIEFEESTTYMEISLDSTWCYGCYLPLIWRYRWKQRPWSGESFAHQSSTFAKIYGKSRLFELSQSQLKSYYLKSEKEFTLNNKVHIQLFNWFSLTIINYSLVFLHIHSCDKLIGMASEKWMSVDQSVGVGVMCMHAP